MLVFERLLRVLVALRITPTDTRSEHQEILPADYHAARALLTCLPLTPVDRELSPQALQTAMTVYEALQGEDTQLALPDLSKDGHKWFTRTDARTWTELGYNTVKKHLHELEGEGILMTTIAENNRERGRQIHYRFAEGRAPPFEWTNPFVGLPDLVASLNGL
jgi:hypothetical protein